MTMAQNLGRFCSAMVVMVAVAGCVEIEKPVLELSAPVIQKSATDQSQLQVAVLPVTDLRKDPGAILIDSYVPGSSSGGSGGFGVSSASEHSEIDVGKPDLAIWVGDAFAAALENRFHAERAATLESAAAPIVLKVAIRDAAVFGWMKGSGSGYCRDARIMLRVQIYQRGALAQTRNYSGDVQECPARGGTSATLAGAMSDLIARSFPDLDATISRLKA